MNRVCIYGAGAIGGNLAARIASSGADVSVIARGANLAAIRANGLVVETPKETITARVKASADPADLGVQDLVLVTTKTPALPDVAAGIAPLLGPETPVVFVINGVPWWYCDGMSGPYAGTKLDMLDPGGVLHEKIGTARTLGGVVYAACSVPAPGVVRITSAHNKVIVGEIDHRITPRAEQIGALLKASGIEETVSADIRADVWTKLLVNLGSAPVAVLTGAPVNVSMAERPIEQATRTIYAEAAEIAEKLGSSVSLNVEAWIAAGKKLPHKPSMLQDLELGRRMEITTMFEATLALARLAGVATPMLDLILALDVIRAKTAGLYG